jgi:hypothetical protein
VGPVTPTVPSRRAVAATATLTAAVVVAAAVPAVLATLPADAAGEPAPPTFQRINVDTAVTGASFTTVGEVYAGEQDIVTSGYGTLSAQGRPTGGGTLQVYRPGANLADWTKVTVFGPEAGIVFPNASTIADVDGDGDRDIVVPSGYFFDSDPADPHARGAITWWENAGAGQPFVRHDVVTGQPWSYHGVQLVDLDDDGIDDLVTVGEQAMSAGDLLDDVLEPQFLRGNGDGTFAAPVALGTNVGGSQPVVRDVDGDGDLDIISSQYFHTFHDAASATFLWLENTDSDGTLTAADFTPRTIATLQDTAAGRGVGMGFQIQPVVGFRRPGEVSWIATNHVNRCTYQAILPIREQVLELVPGADIRAPWTPTTLSDPATSGPACPATYTSSYLTFSDQITSRSGFGQGAPGVFGAGDLDGDGDVDLAVSGDGDRRLWWIEQLPGGATTLHRLTDEGELFGQSGGAAVADLDGDGDQEMVFSSYDRNTVAVWTRRPQPAAPGSSTPTPTPTPTPTTAATLTVPSSLRIGPEARSARKGARVTWMLRLTGAPGGARRTVSVVFDPAKGRKVGVGTVRLSPTGTDGVQTGKVTVRVRSAGRLVVRYAGATVSPTLRDTATTDRARVSLRR